MKKQHIILAIIFLILISFRLYFAFETPNFDYDSYFSLRQIENIKETGFPIFEDDLSYSGRESVFIPTFHYILGFFSLFIPTTFAAKILPNIFASTIIFITYLISKKLTNNINISLFVSFISAFIPVFVSQTINNISVYSLVIPLIFLAIYFFLDLRNEKNIHYFILTVFLLTLIHPSAFLLVSGLLFYTLFVLMSKLKQSQSEIEVILFSTFLVILLQFLIFRKAFIMHGIAAIWQNIPPSLLFQYFQKINIIEAIFKIGLFPLIFGAYIIYKCTLRERNREIYILIGLAASTFILLWLRLVNSNIGLSIIGITLILLFAYYYRSFLLYLKKTRFASLIPVISTLFFLVFLITSVIPAFGFSEQALKNIPSEDEIDALHWLKNDSRSNDIVLGSLTEGHLLNAVSQRKNVIDTNFMLIEDSSKIFDDVRLMFTSVYKIEAMKLLKEYDVDYIFFSPISQKEFEVEEIPYINEECFELVYNKSVKIYENKCYLDVDEYED